MITGPSIPVPSSCTTVQRTQYGHATLCHILPLTHRVQALFDDIKANRIPVDLLELFDAAKAPFYEGMSRSCRLPGSRH